MAGSDPVSPVKSPDRVTGVTLREWTQPTNQRPAWLTSDQSEGEGRGRGMSVAGAGVVTSVVSESVRVQSSPKPEPRADSGRAENIINNTDKYNNLQWLPRREISRGYLRSKINCYWYRGGNDFFVKKCSSFHTCVHPWIFLFCEIWYHSCSHRKGHHPARPWARAMLKRNRNCSVRSVLNIHYTFTPQADITVVKDCKNNSCSKQFEEFSASVEVKGGVQSAVALQAQVVRRVMDL